MQIIYAREPYPIRVKKTIFLAGPSPRNKKTESWRPKALELLEQLGFDGTVIVPEPREGSWNEDPSAKREQIEWEHDGLNRADCIAFWVPRKLPELPGFTTNIEFGLWAKSERLVFGAPKDAANVGYFFVMAEKFGIPTSETLGETMEAAIRMTEPGALRKNAECQIPQVIWNTPSFQSWYTAQKSAGNKLVMAEPEYVLRPFSSRKAIYLWVLYAQIWIAAENRVKTNEVALSRQDLCSIVLYRPAQNWLDAKVVLVRDFRVPSNTPDGFIREVPGGSSWKLGMSPEKTAQAETFEETGLEIDTKRFERLESRQLAGSFSAHKSHLFRVKLTEKEAKWVSGQKGIIHGSDPENPTGERTIIEIKTVRKILNENLVDFSNLGMISTALN